MPTNQQYGSSIRRETSLFANWPPNGPREIGDYGRVNGALFEFYGCLDPEEIKALGKREGPSPAGYDVMINSSRSLSSHLSAEASAANVADGKALLEIKFSSEEGIVFAAPSIKITEITSMAALGRLLNERRREGNWIMDHAVVVQVSAAESATILLSDQDGAGMEFEVAADAPVNAQLVAQLDAGASLLSSHGVGIKIIGEGPLTPLFKLAYLKRRIVGDPRIVYREAVAPGTDDEFEVHDVDDEYVLVVG
ncbi:MAG: hypothetical protein ABSA53_35520 [Streptosporangiaceae bacterium]